MKMLERMRLRENLLNGAGGSNPDRTLVLWVDDDAGRSVWRTILRNIIQSAAGVALLRRHR